MGERIKHGINSLSISLSDEPFQDIFLCMAYLVVVPCHIPDAFAGHCLYFLMIHGSAVTRTVSYHIIYFASHPFLPPFLVLLSPF
jgi:hypothetical protein